jgi:hypothetical protein
MTATAAVLRAGVSPPTRATAEAASRLPVQRHVPRMCEMLRWLRGSVKRRELLDRPLERTQ